MHVMSIKMAKELITGNSEEMSALCPVRIKDARERTRAHTHNTHKYTHTHTHKHTVETGTQTQTGYLRRQAISPHPPRVSLPL